MNRSSENGACCAREVRHVRRGLSLVELVLAMTMAAGIAVVLGNVIHQMTTGVARLERRSQVHTEADLAVLRMRGELRNTTVISSMSSTAITFTHPDVTGDSVADTITYQWNGTLGQPVTRKVNSLAAETLLDNCQSFTLTKHVAIRKLDVKMEMYEATGSAVAKLSWSSASQAKQIIPQTRLYPALVSGIAASGLVGSYYDTSSFTSLKVTRTDATVNFDWGSSAPDSSMGADTFSVRWTGQILPQYAEAYTFYTSSDDGVRLYINDQLIIDNWTDHSVTENFGLVTLIDFIDVHVEAGRSDPSVKMDTTISCMNYPILKG